MKVASHIPHLVSRIPYLSYKSEMRVPGCEIRDTRYEMGVAGYEIRDARFEFRIPHPASRIPDPASRIAYPVSRIPHPVSRITYLVSYIIGRAMNGRRGSSHGRTAI